MKTIRIFDLVRNPKIYIGDFREQDLDYLIEEIEARRNEIYVEKLRAAAFECESESEFGWTFDHILVHSPCEDLPDVWANTEDVKRLVDIKHNIDDTRESYRRWYNRIDTEYEDDFGSQCGHLVFNQGSHGVELNAI